MSLLADNLFALLLGWTRSLFNNLWNLITNNSSGFVGFLQKFWLPILIILLLVGTFFDLIIWLIRWRPYYVWSARLRQWGGHRRLRHTQHYMEDLDHSPLDLPEYQQLQQAAQPAVLDEPVYFDFDVPWQAAEYQPEQVEQEGFQTMPTSQEAEEEPQFIPHLPWEGLRQELLEQNPQLAQNDSQPQQILPLDQVPWQQLEQVQTTDPGLANFAAPPHSGLPPQQAQTRRRRVDNRRQRGADLMRSIRNTFFIREEDMAPVDSIQAPVSPESAFHKPYYPQNYSYKNQQPASSPQEKNAEEHPPQ